MSDYDDNHWDWINNLIKQAETPSPAPQPAAQKPAVTQPAPDAIATAGDSVYAVTALSGGLTSYQPIKGMWR
jgi:hypothetical protein